MKTGTIYKEGTGELSRIVHASSVEDVTLQCSDIESVYWDELTFDKYIVNGEPVDRPAMPISVTGEVNLAVNEVLRINNIPTGTKVLYPGGEMVVDDGYIEWSAVEPMQYVFTFVNFPFKEEVVNAIVG